VVFSWEGETAEETYVVLELDEACARQVLHNYAAENPGYVVVKLELLTSFGSCYGRGFYHRLIPGDSAALEG
jgi:hypothetical protein